MLSNDYMIRSIEMMAQFIASVVFKKKTTVLKIEPDENGNIGAAGELCIQLHTLINDGRICEAEDMLFEVLKKDTSTENLEVAVDFYGYLNTFDDKFLSSSNFSREEITQGLDDIQKLYGITAVPQVI